jgi:alpha-amylase
MSTRIRLAALRLVLPLVAAAAMLHAPAATAQAPAVISDIGAVAVQTTDSRLAADWYRRGTFMEILVRAYQDSNGDGIGDLNGVTSRLDYLKELGITGIWLMPIFKSEDKDHGYAVANYREIEPDYGSLADFDRLLAEAHKRGIGVIVDYVINHSAASHPAFEQAYDGRKSKFNDWYIFKDEPQKGWSTFSGSPWREGNQRWYYGVFDQQMPDFNLRNPEVIDFHLNNLRFWLNRGVDGFRFDAVGVLVENSAIAWENQPENHLLMKRVQDVLAEYGKRYMVCEAPSDPAAFAAASSCGGSFAFGLQKHIIGNIKIGRVRNDLLAFLRTQPVASMGTILANHDFFAGARLMRQFNNDEKSYKMAAATLLTLPGTPFLYYGEEIGLGSSEPVLHDDQAIRGPMSWSDGGNAGFTTAAKPFRPLVNNWKTHNVAVQDKEASSLLNWYRDLIRLRNAEPALSVGKINVLSARDEPVFAFERESGGRKLLVLLNYAYRETRFAMPEGADPTRWKRLWPAGGDLPLSPLAAPKKGMELRMAPQQALVLQLTD